MPNELLKVGKLIYKTGCNQKKLAEITYADPNELEKIYEIFNLFLNSDLILNKNLTAYEIAQKVNLNPKLVNEILLSFLDDCVKAYKDMLKRGGSRAGAAYRFGVNRNYFDDFWLMCNRKYNLELKSEKEIEEIFKEERKRLF